MINSILIILAFLKIVDSKLFFGYNTADENMNEKSLNQIFNSSAKVRILKVFLRNPDDSFSVSEISNRSRSSKSQARSCIKSLASLGIIKIAHNAKKKDNKK